MIKLDSANPSSLRHGVILLQCLLLVLFFVFGVRFWYLQVHKGSHFARLARENKTQSEPMYAPRGIVRDRQGQLLAVNEPAYHLAIVREDSRDIDRALTQIAEWTSLPLDELKETFLKGRPRVKAFEPQLLIPNLSFEMLATIEAHAMDWPELKVVVQPRRYYPQGSLLSHVLGYVAQANEEELNRDSNLALGDTLGKQGIEVILEKTLRGTKGLLQVEVDVVGRNLNRTVITNPEPGIDIRLSIDLDLQLLAAKHLEGRTGSIVVLDPFTGRVLAFVSQPGYDNNKFVMGIKPEQWKELVNDPGHPLQNRSIQSAYPPGSVFKLVVGGAALAAGALDPKHQVFCPGFYRVGNRVFRCWKREGHGWMDFEQGMVQSCDVYFYRLGERLGVDEISRYARAFGFGSKTGIELPHERDGLIPDKEWKRRRFNASWTGGETLNLSIGQGYTLTTPLQVARFIGGLVNGGVLFQPSLLEDGAPVEQGRMPMTDLQRKMVLRTMVQTVEGERGTAQRLRTKGVVVGGKTGTAQVVKLKEEYHKKKVEEIPYQFRDHAWMASFAQQGERAYAIVAMVEHGGSGGATAGPMVKSLIDHLFPQPPKDQP
jgi:penicillin-binding protein 2